jgi:hypothetical protein
MLIQTQTETVVWGSRRSGLEAAAVFVSRLLFSLCMVGALVAYGEVGVTPDFPHDSGKAIACTDNSRIKCLVDEEDSTPSQDFPTGSRRTTGQHRRARDVTAPAVFKLLQ